MRKLLVITVTMVAGCSTPMGPSPQSDVMFLSRKPVAGVAECINWGWDNQGHTPFTQRLRSQPIENGIRLASDGGSERLDIIDIQGKTELNLFLQNEAARTRAPQRVAVIESCL